MRKVKLLEEPMEFGVCSVVCINEMLVKMKRLPSYLFERFMTPLKSALQL
jgi:hypothetical protein